MRRKDTLRHETLLDCAREILEASGPAAINIRSIAQKAGIATGTVYNYFADKDDILLALTEEYWGKTLIEMRTEISADSFCGQLEEMFSFLRNHIEHSAGMLMGSLNNVEAAGQERMKSMQSVLKVTIIQLIEQDANIRSDIWSDAFTKDQYASFILMNMESLLRMRASDMGIFVEIVRRTIY